MYFCKKQVSVIMGIIVLSNFVFLEVIHSQSIDFNAQEIEVWTEKSKFDKKSYRYFLFKGDVTLKYGEVEAKSDTILAWKKLEVDNLSSVGAKNKQASFRQKALVDEIYIPNFTYGKIGEKLRFNADSAYIDVRKKQVTLTNTFLSVSTGQKRMMKKAKKEVKIYIRAKKVEIDKSTVIYLRDALISTCSFAKPHYSIKVDTVKIVRKKSRKQVSPGEGRTPLSKGAYQVDTINLYGININAASILALAPKKNYELIKGRKLKKPFLRGIQYSNGNLYGSKLNILTAYESPPEKQLNFNLFISEKRGIGIEPAIKYEINNHQGYVESFFLHDKGPDPTIDYQRQFLPQEVKNRFRLHLFDKYTRHLNGKDNFYTENMYIITEFDRISDKHLLPEFMEREFKEEREPTSLVQLQYIRDNLGLTITGEFRINSFQTKTEYLPEISLALLNQRLKIPAYYTNLSSASYLRKKFAKSIDRDDVSTTRLTTTNEIYLPIKVWVLTLTPFLSSQNYFYSRAADDKAGFVITEGLKIYTEFFKNFKLVKHNIGFDLQLTNNNRSGLKPANEFDFDQSDHIDSFTEVYLGIYNWFYKADENNIYGKDFMEINMAIEYYPSAKDTGEFEIQNYLSPMNWLTTSLNNYNRRLSNLHLWSKIYFANKCSIGIESQFNLKNKSFETFGSNLTYSLNEIFNFSLNVDFAEDLINAYGLSLYYKFSERWSVELHNQFDFRRSHTVKNQIVFSRNLHDAYLNFIIKHDTGKDENVFYVTFSPSF